MKIEKINEISIIYIVIFSILKLFLNIKNIQWNNSLLSVDATYLYIALILGVVFPFSIGKKKYRYDYDSITITLKLSLILAIIMGMEVIVNILLLEKLYLFNLKKLIYMYLISLVILLVTYFVVFNIMKKSFTKILSFLTFFLMMFSLNFIINFVQVHILSPKTSILVFQSNFQNILIFIISIFMSFLVSEIFFGEREEIVLVALIVFSIFYLFNFFNYGYFTENEVIKSNFGIKREMKLSNCSEIIVYTEHLPKGGFEFIYKIIFENGKRITLKEGIGQPFNSEKLLELDKIIKKYNPKYSFEISKDESKKIDIYEYEIIKDYIKNQ